jgi:hypothetical protein
LQLCLVSLSLGRNHLFGSLAHAVLELKGIRRFGMWDFALEEPRLKAAL